MSMQAGSYKATVIGVSLEAIGDKNTPVLKVVFKPTSFLRGSVYLDGDYRVVDKLYFLSTDLVKTGKNAGLGRLEVLKKELTETFSYTGDLNPANLPAMVGPTVFEITVELNDKGYPQIKWVNKPGGKKTASKPLPSDFLAKLQAAYRGDTASATPVAPADFFKGMQSE